jgi:hypothetical protein
MSSMLIMGAVQFAAYSATQATLVIGDGDFSYSRGLTAHRGSGNLLIATSFDSAADIEQKYGSKVRLHDESIRTCSGASCVCAESCAAQRCPGPSFVLHLWGNVLLFLSRERLMSPGSSSGASPGALQEPEGSRGPHESHEWTARCRG